MVGQWHYSTCSYRHMTEDGHLPKPTQNASKPASWKYLFPFVYFLQSLACVIFGVNSTTDLPLSLPKYVHQLQNSLIEQSLNSVLVSFRTLSGLHKVLAGYWIPINHYFQAADNGRMLTEMETFSSTFLSWKLSCLVSIIVGNNWWMLCLNSS